MSALRRLSATKIVHFAARRSTRLGGGAFDEADRQRAREWIGHLRAAIKQGYLDVAAAELHVKPASVLAPAKSIASPRYPSFWRGGIYARQSTIGVDPDVGLSGRQVARIIDLLVMQGYLERDTRRGRTCLIQPILPLDKVSELPATMSGTPDMVSDESSNLKLSNQKESPLSPPVEPRGEAASGQASSAGGGDIEANSDIAQLEAEARWHHFRNSYPWPPGHGTRRAHKAFLGHTAEQQEAMIQRAKMLGSKRYVRWPETWIADQEFNSGKEQIHATPVNDGAAWRVHLRLELGDDVFDGWFAQARTLPTVGTVASIVVKTRFIKAWIEDKFHPQLLAAWRAHDRAITSVNIKVEPCKNCE
jgi:DnaA N-terminal domain